MLSPQRNGFSLPELMVTLAILVIFATVAVPAMAQFIDRQRASAYIRQFSQHLAYARVAASSSNLPVQFCPMQNGQCSLAWQDAPLQLLLLYPDSNDSQLLRQLPALPSGHNLVYNRSAITFRRDGSLEGFENGTFYYCGKASANWHFRLVLNQAGRSKLSRESSRCPL